MSSNSSDPLFSLRTAVVLLLAVLTGILAGVLTYLATRSLPGATLAGGSAAGFAITLFHTLIGR